MQLVRLLHEEGSCRIFVACLEREGVLRDEIERRGFNAVSEFRLTLVYDANMLRQLRRCAEFVGDNGIEIVQSNDF